MAVTILPGDCREVLASLPADSVHSVLTDPPYHLTSMVKRFGNAVAEREHYAMEKSNTAYMSRGFMGKTWDGGSVAFDPDTWRAVFRVMRPGGFLMASGGTRTYHRLACAIEDAGFEIRDQFAWVYAQGFPKSRDASKAIDQELGAVREVVGDNPNHRAVSGVGYEGIYAGANTGAATITAPATPEAAAWSGFGTAVRPSWEPIVLARKPMVGNLAQNLLRWGCGALNIDGSRIATTEGTARSDNGTALGRMNDDAWQAKPGVNGGHPAGRWPSNIAHDGSPEIMAAFAAAGERMSGAWDGHRNAPKTRDVYGAFTLQDERGKPGDTGTAARFFYTSKADKGDRADSRHPCVKPVDLLRHYMRLITPPGGTCLDCFAGSGTTGEAAMLLGLDCILIERDAASVADIRHRMARWSGRDLPLFVEVPEAPVMGDLFAAVAAE